MITICIPHFNNPTLLKRCLRSLHDNTCVFEVVVVDDFSETITLSALQDIIEEEKNHLRIFYYKNNKNMGVTYTKNKAYLKSKPGWCVFLDCDDYLVPNGIDLLKNLLESTPINILLLHCCNIENTFIPPLPIQIPLEDYINFGTGSEALTIFNKSKSVKRPYLSFLRGYEGLGVMLNASNNNFPIMLGNIAIRVYTSDSSNRLSSRRGFISRANLIAQGHLISVTKFWRKMKFHKILRLLALAIFYTIISTFVSN